MNRRGLLLAALLLLVASAASSGLFVSFDDYATDEPRYRVTGTIDGLEGATVTVSLNGGTGKTVHDHESFSFEQRLANHASYSITVTSPLDHPRSVDGALTNLITGAISDADANVAIHCPSNDARLMSLSVSGGPLSPEFDAGTFKYTVLASAIVPLQTMTATPTARAKGAQLAVNDAGVESGTASAPVAITPPAATPIRVVVTAPDSTTTKTYAVDVVASAIDYIKASNTRPSAFFGSAVALSGDTLAIGANGESSSGTGVNGDQTIPSAAGSGAVYIFTRAGGVWSQEAYINASNPQRDTQFGFSVALDGNTLVVGSVTKRATRPA